MAILVSLYQDTRTKKKSGKFPVRLQVYNSQTKKRVYYNLGLDLSIKEFQGATNSKKQMPEYKELRVKLNRMVSKANEVIDSMVTFDFDLFKKKYLRTADQGSDVFYQYGEFIKQLRPSQIKTASSYELSKKSIKSFLKERTGKEQTSLSFYEINPKWLEDYQYYMTEEKGKSITTVGIYLRSLRRIFNIAIDEEEIQRDYYPFGASRRKYSIPTGNKTKRALNAVELKKLIDSKPKTKHQQIAKDFWLFSYVCNGMNFKDIALLKWENFRKDQFQFFRAKTKGTSKSSKPIIVYLNSLSSSVIEKYGSKEKKGFVFDILKPGISEIEKSKRISHFIRNVNQNIKVLCKDIGLPADTSTYWARHTFTTIAIRNGSPIALLQESLGHQDISTTQNYINGFEPKVKKEMNEKLLNL